MGPEGHHVTGYDAGHNSKNNMCRPPFAVTGPYLAGCPNFDPPRFASRGAKHHILHTPQWLGSVFWRDAQADVPLAQEASGATCVQKLDGSQDSAIHTRYRILLRSSSMREPRYPLPRVVRL